MLLVANGDTLVLISSGRRRDVLPESKNLSISIQSLSPLIFSPNYNVKDAMFIITRRPILEVGSNPTSRELHTVERGGYMDSIRVLLGKRNKK